MKCSNIHFALRIIKYELLPVVHRAVVLCPKTVQVVNFKIIHVYQLSNYMQICNRKSEVVVTFT